MIVAVDPDLGRFEVGMPGQGIDPPEQARRLVEHPSGLIRGSDSRAESIDSPGLQNLQGLLDLASDLAGQVFARSTGLMGSGREGGMFLGRWPGPGEARRSDVTQDRGVVEIAADQGPGFPSWNLGGREFQERSVGPQGLRDEPGPRPSRNTIFNSRRAWSQPLPWFLTEPLQDAEHHRL